MRLSAALAATFVVGALVVGAIAARAQSTPKTEAGDPFAWLEDIHGARALDWVKGQNAKTALRLEGDKRFEPYRQQALAIFTAKDRIPYPRFRGAGLDNVWQDAAHPHGVWRRTTLASYRTEAPQWDELLDLDALSAAEGKSWFWKGAQCLRPAERYCLIELSNGGGDAVTVREFDTQTKAILPHRKGRVRLRQRQAGRGVDRQGQPAGRPRVGAGKHDQFRLRLYRQAGPLRGGRWPKPRRCSRANPPTAAAPAPSCCANRTDRWRA